MPSVSAATAPGTSLPITGAQPSNVALVQTPVAVPGTASLDRSSLSHTNPYQGYNAAMVTVQPWKQGDNDCLERILLNHGFTLHQIYSNKGALLAQTAAANHLKSPNLVRSGQQLVVPSLLPSADEHTRVLNTQGLDRGETRTAHVGTDQASVDATVARNEDGTRGATVVTHPQQEAAGITETNQVSAGGRISVVAKQVDPKTAAAQVVARNSDDTARTTSNITVTPTQSHAVVTETDGGPGKMRVTVANNNVGVVNPGKRPGDNVRTDIDVDPHHNDGPLASAGRWLNDHIFGAATPATLSVNGASNVDVTQTDGGASTITVTGADGHTRTVQNPGQSVLERAGASIDHANEEQGKLMSEESRIMTDPKSSFLDRMGAGIALEGLSGGY